MTAPRIETERLVLRPHRMEDFPGMAEFFASDLSRYVGGPMPPRQAWLSFASDVGSWELMGFGALAIEEKATGAFAGQIGLNKPPHFPEREIGWNLLSGFGGRGYATEAALAARAYAYGTLGWTTAVSYIDPENAPSIALARRIGCTEDPDAARYDPGDLVFRHPAPEPRR